MEHNNMNTIVAKELSEALAKCKQQGVDPGTVRTGLLTITIANFINGIGMENTSSLFSVLPEQIQSGIFDRFIDPNLPQPNAPYAANSAASNTPPPFKPYNPQYMPPSATRNMEPSTPASIDQQPLPTKRRRL
ncbi:hypothetical protein NBZ79_08160 [Sneathiella marina]|uniref:Uncharacterized protein n=1 Tax=Sneathiella marina TaxID=2950108 RepID=A0ABY4WB08_9PROT|nr:hypothetical protein [Sneathiella marina]USG62950.1 hypothetical protein NBZ79_08160 [Sneathiella marina]